MELWLEIFGALSSVAIWAAVAVFLIETKRYLAGIVWLLSGFTTEVYILIHVLK